MANSLQHLNALLTPIIQIKESVMELFQWLGDMNLGERSHLLQPIEIERNIDNEPLHKDHQH